MRRRKVDDYSRDVKTGPRSILRETLGMSGGLVPKASRVEVEGGGNPQDLYKPGKARLPWRNPPCPTQHRPPSWEFAGRRSDREVLIRLELPTSFCPH